MVCAKEFISCLRSIEHKTLCFAGTRFIGHRLTAFTELKNVWPALITFLSNVAVDKKTNSAVRSKVTGILGKLESFVYLCICVKFAHTWIY